MIRRAALGILSAPPILAGLRALRLRHGSLRILCYHTLGPDAGGPDGWSVLRQADFAAQVRDLRRHFDIVSLQDGLRRVGKNPRPMAALTFDDGEAGLFHHLLPVLQRDPVPVTVYVATEQIETGKPFWFDRVVSALPPGAPISVDLSDDGLGRWILPAEPGRARWDVLRQILDGLKTVPPQKRETLSDNIVAMGYGRPDAVVGPMTVVQLTALAADPSVTIAAHSHGHELLDQVSPDVAKESLTRCRQLLQDWTGNSVDDFAFPNGNHTPALRRLVADLGFRTATVLEDRPVVEPVDPFQLPRFSVGRYDHLDRVRLRLLGV